jgi:hypothetical protein
MTLVFRHAIACLLWAFVIFLTGCQEEGVRHYTAPKERFLRTSPQEEDIRLLGALAFNGDIGWGFKLMGTGKEIDAHKAEFDEFIHTIRFTDKDSHAIQWKALASWHKLKGDEYTHASFLLGPDTRPLRLTVSRLEGASAKSVLLNVNRWRGQLHLPELPGEDDLKNVCQETEVGGVKVILVDMTGSEAAKSEDALSAPIYVKPEDWQKIPDPKGMRLAVFRIVDGDKSAEVGITRVATLPNGLLRNVNRWRGQLGLEPTTPDRLPKEVQNIQVDGTAATSIDLSGKENSDSASLRLLGVLVERKTQTWTFTLKGPADLVDKQKAVFDAFVQSVRWK